MMYRHAESDEDRNFYVFISDISLHRAQWEYIRNEEPKLYETQKEK